MHTHKCFVEREPHKLENVQKWLSRIKVTGMTSRHPRSGHCSQVAKIIQLILFDPKNKNTKIIWLNGAARFGQGRDTVYKTLKRNNCKGSSCRSRARLKQGLRIYSVSEHLTGPAQWWNHNRSSRNICVFVLQSKLSQSQFALPKQSMF